MKASAAVIVALLVSGCAVLNDEVDKAAGAAARAVDAYCANFTPDQREDFGDRVRTRTGNDIRVTCQ